MNTLLGSHIIANGILPNFGRPADIYLPTWSRGRPATLDVHVISPLQQQTLGEAAFSPGHALQVGVQRKLSSHLSNCRSAGLEFIPLVFETLGFLPWTIHCPENWPPGRLFQATVPSCCNCPVAGGCRIVVALPAIPPPLSRRFSVVYISVFF